MRFGQQSFKIELDGDSKNTVLFWNIHKTIVAPPEEKDGFKGLIMTIDPDGGGDNLENGLDAITYAIRSDWTDASTHEAGFAGKSQYYPKWMPKNFVELTALGDECVDGNASYQW